MEIDMPDLSMLPVRLVNAAVTIENLNDYLQVASGATWGPHGLREEAARLRRALDERELRVRELALDLARDYDHDADCVNCLEHARSLAARGWTKAANQ